MEKFKITKNELQALYLEELNDVLEQCGWITHVTSEQVCMIISNVMSKKGYSVPYSELYEFYDAEVKKINLDTKNWHENQKIPEIISIIHDILVKHF